MTLRPLRSAVAAWTPGRVPATDPLQAIVAAWVGIVGEHVAGNAAPLELVGPALVIATRSSAWSQQLHFLSETILTGIRALPGVTRVERLQFRAGALRAEKRRGFSARPVRSPVGTRPAANAPLPAADAPEALARLRERVGRLQRAAQAVCRDCGAARSSDAAPTTLCAPCAGNGSAQRALAAERLLYLCPWLDPAAVREQIPGLAPGEVERIRRRLLGRWWVLLERARLLKRISAGGRERSIASSYLLLQSRLPPDRITPAVVRNLLGDELERLLWPTAPVPGGEPQTWGK